MNRSVVTRRRILRLAAASGAVGLAGCTGGDGDPGDGGTSSLEPGEEKVHCESGGTDLAGPALSIRGAPSIRFSDPERKDSSRPAVSATQASGGVPLEEVPVELHRRAAQLIERVRGTEAAPGWKAARLRNVAYPYLRPDIDGVAYYEFEVEPEGFIVLSTGVHEFPVAHWNHVGPSLSRRLEALARQPVDPSFGATSSIRWRTPPRTRRANGWPPSARPCSGSSECGASGSTPNRR